MRQLTLATALAGVLLAAGGAGAQALTRAEEVWERGAADWRAGKLDTGCPAIEESYRLDPEPGALFASAECHAQWGKVLAAVQRYEAYLLLEPQLSTREHGRRLTRARAGVSELAPQVPQLLLQLAQPAGILVTLDGVPLAAAQLGSSIPLEVGPHWIETRRGSAPPQRLELTLARGETRRLWLDPPALPAAGAAAGSASAPDMQSKPGATSRGGAPPRPAVLASRSPGAERAGSGAAMVGWVAGAIGAAGVIVGSAAGISALQQKSIVDDECAGPLDSQGRRGCTDRGWSALQRGEPRATLAVVSLGVGVAGLVTGAILLLQGSASTPEEEASSWQPELRTGDGGTWLGVTHLW